jgi:DNA-binding CsgD family transcriptional regulator
MAEASDPFNRFNERLKALDTLTKRESELLQKLSQADSDRDIAAKLIWAKELVEVLAALRRFADSRAALTKELK